MLNPDRLRGTFGQRPWIAGICAAIAAEFDLPVMVVRCIALMFAVLPASRRGGGGVGVHGGRPVQPASGRVQPRLWFDAAAFRGA
jgi:phage shock protein PspC (stress-responsive transcriptional regulator)